MACPISPGSSHNWSPSPKARIRRNEVSGRTLTLDIHSNTTY